MWIGPRVVEEPEAAWFDRGVLFVVPIRFLEESDVEILVVHGVYDVFDGCVVG